ncbi:glycine cleavage system P-protein-domain-containing protein [Limtongia smithiae]|uniref:glycine cleavage system P-protein-domain-containing protein n=1 Tax=Limtongia smithiae TaxID=1125753 RepID=UPI0034CF083D
MLETVGYSSMETFVKDAVPKNILTRRRLNISPAAGFTESELYTRLKQIAKKNKVLRSYIGSGYYGTFVPPVVQRNLLECPEWYTSYTPYQPEISQGRLESLLNFQTLVTDLTGMGVANASLLDEGTAAAEAMLLSYHNQRGKKKSTYYVDPGVNTQTLACLKSRASTFGIQIVHSLPGYDALQHTFLDAPESMRDEDLFGAVVQYPSSNGELVDWRELCARVHASGGLFAVATDLLALTILQPPSKFNADISFGSAQRFGVPMGFGGPHAAFFAVSQNNSAPGQLTGLGRKIPGRIVGVSKDRLGAKAYRLAIQTREQHIRREKATSNICTAQALLANMTAMYAVYHGPEGLREIASRVHGMCSVLAVAVQELGYDIINKTWFDTLTIQLPTPIADDVLARAVEEYGINLGKASADKVVVSLDETVTGSDLVDIVSIFNDFTTQQDGTTSISLSKLEQLAHKNGIPKPTKTTYFDKFAREDPILRHDVFNRYHTETEMLRYIHALQVKDLSLANSMIPLGSCTMKLNSTTSMVPISWEEFNSLHPFVPKDQALGYAELITELENDLADITGFDAVTVQPNSGAQGEYTGLRVIKAYFDSVGETQRNVCLISVSAHGTNPASAVMAGMKVVSIKCLPNGDLDLDDLAKKSAAYSTELAALMITYPSTFGVFESRVKEAVDIVHSYGGQVYMDGANMNAQIGLCSPGDIGADVCHLNLHKTFCIPHGGGGPGVGPVCVKKHLAPFLPSHPILPHAESSGEKAILPVSAAPFGSASILIISWAYIKLMGSRGLTQSTEYALLNANYMMRRLRDYYPISFTNSNGLCAHEFIVDIKRMMQDAAAQAKNDGTGTPHIDAIDVAKRLQDYGFHAPTMSWPVPGTLMIEPTESECKAELDRFCDAMIAIRAEIDDVLQGHQPAENNVLVNAPHPVQDLIVSDGEAAWDRPYTREKAAFPLAYLRERKFWPAVARLDDQYGDLNFFCTCDPPPPAT